MNYRKLKYLGILALFITFSFFTACNQPVAEKGFPKGDYNTAPPEIMQAELTKTDGTTFKLDDYRGKVILVNLWATWCGPCVAEMPEFVTLQNENKEQGFEIIGLNLDEAEDAQTVKAFGEKLNINYLLAKGDESIAGAFLKISKADVIPQSFLIDREGRLVGVFVGGGKNVDKIRESVKKFL